MCLHLTMSGKNIAKLAIKTADIMTYLIVHELQRCGALTNRPSTNHNYFVNLSRISTCFHVLKLNAIDVQIAVLELTYIEIL